MKKLLALLLALAMTLTCVFALAESTETPEDAAPALSKPLVILFSSDVHCGIDDNYGYAGLAAIRDYYAQDNYVALVDNGDAIQGNAMGTATNGGDIIDLMNVMNYDSITIGNHEFDYGMDRFLEIANTLTNTPYISCNFTYKGELVFDPYVIKEYDGVKVAFVGVTTPDTFTSSTPAYFMEDGEYVYGFCEGNNGENLYAAVQSAVDAARAEGAQYVILQSHLGIDEVNSPYMSTDVITHTTGIDVVLDGHSHSIIDPSETVENDAGMSVNYGDVKNAAGDSVMLIACGTKLETVATVTIDTEGNITGKVYPWQFEDNATKVWGLTGTVVDAVAEKNAALEEKLNVVVGHTDVDLCINDPATGDRMVRCAETNAGDLCADAYRAQAGDVDIAFVNGGGIRVDIPAGDLTMQQLMNLHPFGNYLTVVEATGQQILDYLEWNVRKTPGESGGFAQCSGLTYEIHTYIESTVTEDEHGSFASVEGERRVQNVLVNGEPIDPEKTYTVASHDYMLLNGGDGNNMFQNDVVLQRAVKLDYQVVIDYITENLGGNVGEEYADPYGQGRIVVVTEPQQ